MTAFSGLAKSLGAFVVGISLKFLKLTLLSGLERGGVRNTELYQGHLPKTTSFGFLFHSECRRERTLRKGES